MTHNTPPALAILGMGDMGSAVAQSLVKNGLTVYTCLAGRSKNSRKLARLAGVLDTSDMTELITRADVFLSILPPASARAFAAEVCPVIRKHSPNTIFVDCNAISPDSCKTIAEICAQENVRYQDVGIVGAAPRAERIPVRLYTSGPFSSEIQQLRTEHIEVKDLGEEIGKASAIKMVYASLSKGTIALRAAAAIAAERLGVSKEIQLEWQHSMPAVFEAMQQRFPVLSADASRWAGEMLEISQTFDSVDLTSDFHRGAAWMYEQIAATSLGEESKQEALEQRREMQQVIRVWSAAESGDV
jgi:3-hydroxyisobutyrate dehydrogenase-like beta-hydroxyacid dehydrogenase